MKNQGGYFLIIAVILILVMGLMGSIVVYLFANRAQLSVAQSNGLKAFYLAESGLEIGTRILTNPTLSSRIGCGSLTGNAQTTNATLGSGTFTLTSINNTPIFTSTTLSSALTSSSSEITVASTSNFAPIGRILIDKEAIDYASISGNTFSILTRGAGGTVAASHTSGTRVSQYQCSIDSQSGIPSVASPTYQRELQWNVALQDGWAVGNLSGSNFIFTHWNYPTEVAWNAVSVAGGSNVADLNAVSMLSHADGWAVGDRASGNFTFMRWNGSSWTLSTLAGACPGQQLLGVSMVSSQQAFAVGARYRPGCGGGGPGAVFRYTVLYWNGSSWSLLTPSTSPSIPADSSSNHHLNAVHVIDTNNDGLANIGFAVGNNGQILSYNGTNWVTATSPVSTDLNGIAMVSSSQGWAVGASGVIIRWNGSSWSSVSSPTTTNLNAIAMLDTNDDGLADKGWAVGDTGTILSYNGSTWSQTTVGSNNLLGVSIINQQDVWAVGVSGTAIHWDGNSWTTVSASTSQDLNDISLIPQKEKPAFYWEQVFD